SLALLGHQALELVLVDGEPALGSELAGQLEREPVRVVEEKRVLAGDAAAVARDLLEQLEAALERLREALLLVPDDLADLSLVLAQLRVPRMHLLDDDAGDRPELGKADPAAVLDGSADNAAQDISPALVRRDDAV